MIMDEYKFHHEKGCDVKKASLLHDSLVVGKNGNLVKIQDLVVGDAIQSLDINNNRIINTKITKIVKNNPRTYYYSINQRLFITNDHHILVLKENQSKWIKVENLKTGDTIKSLKDHIKIMTLERIEKPASTVYMETESGNFVIKAGDNYYVAKSQYMPLF